MTPRASRLEMATDGASRRSASRNFGMEIGDPVFISKASKRRAPVPSRKQIARLERRGQRCLCGERRVVRAKKMERASRAMHKILSAFMLRLLPMLSAQASCAGDSEMGMARAESSNDALYTPSNSSRPSARLKMETSVGGTGTPAREDEQ